MVIQNKFKLGQQVYYYRKPLELNIEDLCKEGIETIREKIEKQLNNVWGGIVTKLELNATDDAVFYTLSSREAPYGTVAEPIVVPETSVWATREECADNARSFLMESAKQIVKILEEYKYRR